MSWSSVFHGYGLELIFLVPFAMVSNAALGFPAVGLQRLSQRVGRWERTLVVLPVAIFSIAGLAYFVWLSMLDGYGIAEYFFSSTMLGVIIQAVLVVYVPQALSFRWIPEPVWRRALASIGAAYLGVAVWFLLALTSGATSD